MSKTVMVRELRAHGQRWSEAFGRIMVWDGYTWVDMTGWSGRRFGEWLGY
jgi:hypothetical protein